MSDLPHLIALVLTAWATPEALALVAAYINRLLGTVTRDD